MESTHVCSLRATGRRLLSAAAVVLALLPPPAAARPAAAEPASAPSLEPGSHVLATGGRRIHYEVHGDGPPLMVMPNAWGITTGALRRMFGGLEAHRTLVYFDPRGMGGSSPAAGEEDYATAAVREDFEALRRHLGLGAVDALGWSAGATALLQHALDHPESLRSAVIVHTVARFGAEDGQAIAESHPELVAANREFMQRFMALPPEEQDAALGEFQIEVGFPMLFADPEAGRRHLREVFGDMRFSWPHSRQLRQNESLYDLRDRLPGLGVPLLVLAGAHDLLPPERVREIAELAPRAEYHLFEDSGHFAQLEEPAGLVRVVEAFLASPAEAAAEPAP
jgi:proline iminopeptidase